MGRGESGPTGCHSTVFPIPGKSGSKFDFANQFCSNPACREGCEADKLPEAASNLNGFVRV